MSLSVRAAAGARGDADGAAVSARKTVDFEGLSFAAGSHLNTNKNINLPPGSTRTTDKVRCCFILFKTVTCVTFGFCLLLLHETGQMSSICSFAADNAQVPPLTYIWPQGWEEIQVPALKKKPYASDEKDVLITELPEWMQPAFVGMKSLNRIQSRVMLRTSHSPAYLAPFRRHT